jgi:hypothetical protein
MRYTICNKEKTESQVIVLLSDALDIPMLKASRLLRVISTYPEPKVTIAMRNAIISDLIMGPEIKFDLDHAPDTAHAERVATVVRELRKLLER